MKHIFLSIVVIGALVVAGIGGTFADFSDIEISEDNYFATGALDLVVSNDIGTEYPDDVPKFFMVKDAWPSCDKSVFLDLHNYGQGWQVDPYCYIHLKNLDCGWVMPKKPYAWLDEEGRKVDPPAVIPAEGTFGTTFPRPVTEPEYVAEMGGVAGELEDGTPVTVVGIGKGYGENTEVAEHVDFHIEVAGPYDHGDVPTSVDVPDLDWKPIDLSEYDKNGDGVIKLNELLCEEILLMQIPNCKMIWVHIWAHLQDIDEDDLPAGNQYFDDTIPAEAKWDHWPTNAIQKDYMEFDMAFELLQNAIP